MIHSSILPYLRPISEEEQSILDGQQGIERDRYMNTGSDIIDASKLLSTGKLITIRPHTRFIHFPEHTHNYVEVVYMASGSTTHIVNGTTITLKEGELLFLGQGTRQEILPASENDIAVNFIILPQFFDRTLEMLEDDRSPLRRFIIDTLSGSGNASYLYFQVAEVLPIQNLIENLLYTLTQEATLSTTNPRSINQTTMGLLFMQLLNHTDKLVHESQEEAMILQVFRYIEEHYKDGTLTEIASLLHYDLYALSREIKRRTGKTFKDLLQEKRLTQAAYLLKHTSLHVDIIGETIGYSNLSYFHRIFQEKYGLTPKKFRDSL